MADEIKQLIDMVAELKETVDNRFDDIETAIEELNETQTKILNSIRLIEKDVKSNKMHIERLEEDDLFI